MGIMTKQSSQRTSAHWKTEIEKHEAETEEVQSALEELHARRGPVLVDGTDVEKADLRRKIADASLRLEELEVIISTAGDRHDEAVRAEENAELERTMVEARKLGKLERESYRKIHRILSEFHGLAREIIANRSIYEQANNVARAAGRKDLVVLPIPAIVARETVEYTTDPVRSYKIEYYGQGQDPSESPYATLER